MLKRFVVVAAWLVAFAISPVAPVSGQRPPPPEPKVKVGDTAPDFTLPGPSSARVALHDFLGKKNVVLAFYTFAFTGGSGRQMQNLQQNLSRLAAADTEVLGISMDSPFTNTAWAEKLSITFPLLSDWGGDTTKAYGLLQPSSIGAPFGRSAAYLVDKTGKVVEMRLDTEALDPSPLVESAERRKK